MALEYKHIVQQIIVVVVMDSHYPARMLFILGIIRRRHVRKAR